MGLFQHKQGKKKPKSPIDEATDQVKLFFDEQFREELQERGRMYFEQVIIENANLLKKDLDATVSHVNSELQERVTKQLDDTIAQVGTDIKAHITKHIDGELIEYTKTVREAQDAALKSLNSTVVALQKQHQELSTALQKNVVTHEAALSNVFEENKARLLAMKDAQDAAMGTLVSTVKALQDQHQQLSVALQQNVANQEAMLVNAFEGNMSQIIEHYLLTAIGDQFDMKTQLPGIIKQMEANKQAIVDDMKL